MLLHINRFKAGFKPLSVELPIYAYIFIHLYIYVFVYFCSYSMRCCLNLASVSTARLQLSVASKSLPDASH